MLAFIDSPIQIGIALIVVLLIFGPDKVPELGKQLGKAMRDLRRAKEEFTNSFHVDDDYLSNNEPSNYVYRRYDEPDALAANENAAIAAKPDPPRGDFAAAAFSDSTDDYGVQAKPTVENTVTRSK